MATINTEAISVPINFPRPGVSLNITDCQIIMSTGYSQKFNIHGYPITGFNRSIISGVMSGVSPFQGFKSTGVQEHRSQEYQMSGNNIIIMPSPRKVIVMNMPYNTGIRGNSIRSGVTMSGQCTCTMWKRAKWVLTYDIYRVWGSDVKYDLSSASVRYQVSWIRYQVQHIKCWCQISRVVDQVQSITYRVPASDIKCQV